MQKVYRIATKKRLYSTTPIVEVIKTIDENGKEKENEVVVICVTLPKREGDKLSEKILKFLTD